MCPLLHAANPSEHKQSFGQTSRPDRGSVNAAVLQAVGKHMESDMLFISPLPN